MNRYLTIVIAAAGLSAGCSTPLYRAARLAERTRDPNATLAAANAYFARGEYLSALRLAYLGADAATSDLRFTLLAGLVYDRGLHRADLAIPEYERAKALRPWTDLPARLSNRIAFLHRQQLAQRVSEAVNGDRAHPLRGWSLAMYPVDASELPLAEGTGEALTAVLYRVLAPDATTTATDSAPFATAVALAYTAAHRDASPASFAAWCGAARTAVGTLLPDGRGGAHVHVQLLDSDGSVTAEARSTVQLDDPRALLGALRKPVQEWAGPTVEIPAPLPLSLYGLSLQAHREGRLASCLELLDEAVGLTPETGWLAALRDRVAQEHAGEQEAAALVRTWRQILSHPDPTGALRPSGT